MFFRLLLESFVRQRRRKILAGLAILLGVTAVTAMLALATTIGDRIHKELAVYGANIIVYPKADTLDVKVGDQSLKPATGHVYLHERDLEKLRGIFWANNITGVSPELTKQWFIRKEIRSPSLEVTAVGGWFDHTFGPLTTGMNKLHPSWRLEGKWPQPTKMYHQFPEHSADSLSRTVEPCHVIEFADSAKCDPSEAVITTALAKHLDLRIGDVVSYVSERDTFEDGDNRRSTRFKVTGIVTTDAAPDERILTDLSTARLEFDHGLVSGDQGDAVSRIEISARTRPEDAFARLDPDKLSPKQHDLWYCRPYANSIAYQIREAIPGSAAEQVRQVEQSEGTILERISGLMWLIAAAALLAAAVAVSAAMATAVLERRAEIGLMRSLGASKGRIASLFYAEAGLLALIGGAGGYALGSLLAAILSAKIFADTTSLTHAFNPVLLPVVLALALLVAIAGSTASIRGALRMDPSAVLRADA